MNQELQTTLAGQINDKWRSAREKAHGAETLSLDAMNELREIGQLLNGSKWREIQGEMELGERQIQMCLSFARKHPEPVVDATRAIRLLDEIRMTTGLLPFETHGPQQAHSPNFFSVISKQVVAFRAEWKKQLARSPLDKWERGALEQFVHQIDPMVTELNSIRDSARNQLALTNATP